ncbi:MAG TPA: TRAP transporter substrate-binding protein DctP [Steroidobacteraceae bacterium]|nr:TRAP transporter substrate-binding protein DctP [Steroidobacteraceae bacterium]
MRVLALLGALALAACSAPPLPEDVTVLTYASPYSPNHPFSRADIRWMKWVEAESHGKLRIRAYWSGSLLSSEQSLTELRHEVADIGLITPIYSRGGTQLIRAQSGFYGGARTFEQQTALYRCLIAAEPEFARELHGLKILAVQGGNLPGIVTRERPVRSLDNLRGLRLRAPSELLGVLEDLGADPVDMPMGEVYSALAKGVIDGVVAPADTLKSLHFAEVAHYFNTISIPRGAYAARAMSSRRWAALDPAAQRILEAGIAVWEQALSDEVGAANRAGERAGHEKGVVFTEMPAADQQRFEAVYERDARKRAQALDRFGIDGMPTFRRARAIAAGIATDGRVTCERGAHEPAA